MEIIAVIWALLVIVGLVVLWSGPVRGMPANWYTRMRSGKVRLFLDFSIVIAGITLLVGMAWPFI